mmetsp:Transcript_47721/g.109807  ORF Transcript_47721/g.109807 Transcript_47721/m.109807 type:complete len:168 (-) Transcript_47721:207-710(-)
MELSLKQKKRSSQSKAQSTLVDNLPARRARLVSRMGGGVADVVEVALGRAFEVAASHANQAIAATVTRIRESPTGSPVRSGLEAHAVQFIERVAVDCATNVYQVAALATRHAVAVFRTRNDWVPASAAAWRGALEPTGEVAGERDRIKHRLALCKFLVQRPSPESSH